ncbi:hypothetical protein FCL47_14400 [Desulfopila sp. IMCC35006]|uniref:hypothetical protein n=1 Tax=Desulfopila sp. IMCC35006 TaxID=2569542 RepID=UPI0010AC46A0|nr:hypothetical protein [Desulfopila sp. IMCC35006]TKB25246.1 hypothetical protein FCL47_14400 [Desulfopila sp. IMCC35006]
MKDTLCQMPSAYADQPTATVTLEMPVELVEKLQEAAALDGTDFQAIINCYVQQGLRNSTAEVRRLQFEEHAKKILAKQGVDSGAVEQILHKVEF